MNKVDLSSYDNSWYAPGGGALKRLLWYYVNLLFFKSYWFPFSGLKVLLLRAFGAKIGRGCNMKPNVNIKYPWKLQIGDHCWIGEGVWIDNLDKVNIGNHVCLSQGAYLLCGNHDYKSSSFDLIVQPIEICEGAWIGAMSIVAPGVKVGRNAVLSAMSIATKDLEDDHIYQGNPAVQVKKREIEAKS